MKSILTVGSVAFDSVKTPFGEVSRVVAGAATYFSIAASFFTEVRLVGVVGDDFLDDHLSVFSGRRVELDGLQRVAGETFRWRGEYSADLNTRETIYTHLNVFEGFSPRIPDRFRDTPFVFLANIHPSLQLEVLEQVEQPELVALDTMNYWIEGASEELQRVLARVDVLVINDSEARQLSGEGNLVKAARIIQGMGPERVVIKRGEYGALMTTPEGFFAVPGLPLNRVCDPTGAGDTFAGGFVGFLAAATKITDQVVNQAVIAGSAMASFTVEEFGLERLLTITDVEIKQRFRQFKRLTHFDEL